MSIREFLIASCQTYQNLIPNETESEKISNLVPLGRNLAQNPEEEYDIIVGNIAPVRHQALLFRSYQQRVTVEHEKHEIGDLK